MRITDHFRQTYTTYVLFLLFALPVIVFILLPIIWVLIESFSSEGVITGRNYLAFFRKRYYYGALINSLTLATVTTSLSVVLGTILALFITRTTYRFRLPVRTLSLIPLIVPHYIFTLSLIIIFGRRGILSTYLGIWINILGFPGIVIAQVVGFTPIAYILIENVLISYDPNLEDAAYDQGASQLKVLLKITLPLAVPGILKAFLLVFIRSMADFATPLLIGGGLSLLATDAYLLIVGEYDTSMASVLCMFLVLPGIAIFVAHKYLIAEKSYTTISGKLASGEPQKMAPQLAIPIITTCTVTSLFIVVNLFIILICAFIKAPMFDNTFTLEYIMSESAFICLQNSFKMAILAALFGSMFSVCLSYVISRGILPFTSNLEFVSLLGFCVPGTVMGIGYVLFFNRIPFLVGTLLLISLNTTFRNLAVGVEAGTSKLKQLDISLEEAANDLGANKVSTFLRIVLPLMKSSYFASFLFTFMEGMITVSAVIFLITPDNQLASLKILENVGVGLIGEASGVSVLLISAVIISVLIVNLLTRKTYKL
jgi:iron(III) transport system permease protein